MKCFKMITAILILACGAFLAYIYSGVADVAATAPDGPVTRWVLGTIRERSISTHVKNIQVPPLTDPKMVETGFVRYNKMCAECHLAPGTGTSAIRAGLNPRPPVLARVVSHTPPAELFWIIKNGIKMTGMPAWGQTQDDASIWTIVAFLEKLHTMTPAEYRAMQKEAAQAADIHTTSVANNPPTKS